MQSAGAEVEDGGRNRCEVKNPSIRLLEKTLTCIGGGGWGRLRGRVAVANPSYRGATPWTSRHSIAGPRWKKTKKKTNSHSGIWTVRGSK